MPDLARAPERKLCILLAAFVALWLAGFTRGHLSGSDELNVFETTRSLAERGSLAIPEVPLAYPGKDGRLYSIYSVGSAVALLPFYELGSLARKTLPFAARRAIAGEHLQKGPRRWGGDPEIAAAMLYGPVATGALVALFFLIQRELGASLRSSLVASLALGVGTYVALMSSYLLRHTNEGIAVLGAVYFWLRWQRTGDVRSLAAGSAFASATLLVREPAVVVALGLAVLLVPPLLARHREARDPRSLGREALALAGPALAVLAIHAITNWVRWGTLLQAPLMLQNSRFPYPIYLSAWGFLLSPGASIFVYSPVLLLAPWALRELARSHRVLAAAILTVFATFLVFFSLYDGWTGLWAAPGPRYLFVPLLFLMIPLGRWLDGGDRRRRLATCLALGAFGLLVNVAFLATHFGLLANELRYPDYEPKWSFLFIPDENGPVIATLRAFFAGRHSDLWIVRLASGWAGRDGTPLAAAAVAFAWLTAVVACGAALARSYRRTLGAAEGGATNARPAA
jgi:hypothetical protein